MWIGASIVDVSNPTKPFLAGSYESPGSTVSMAVSNDVIYLADSGGGLVLLDHAGKQVFDNKVYLPVALNTPDP